MGFRFPIAKPLIGETERKNVLECLDKHWISSAGPFVASFEEAFALKWGMQHGIAVSNGTMAIELAFQAIGLEPDDEVLVPDLTFVGALSPIRRLGAKPVLVPCEADSWNMDMAAAERLVSARTKAILATHLFGIPCDILKVKALADAHRLSIIEDCAEATGAKVAGKLVGTFGDISVFSFFGNKVITTGEGGMCLTNSPEYNARIRLFRDHGMRPSLRYWHEVVGYNGRMTNVQAAIGLGQLERLDAVVSLRDRIQQGYARVLMPSGYFLPVIPKPGVEPVTWLASFVLSPQLQIDREPLLSLLADQGIETRPFFFPASQLPPYADCGKTGPSTTFFATRGFNLPTYEELPAADVDWIANEVLRTIRKLLTAPQGLGVLQNPSVSVILPTFNEAGNIAPLAQALGHQFSTLGKTYEILVVDDQSTDGTQQKVEELQGRDPHVRLIQRHENPGLANSILDGIMKSSGDYLLVMDSDFNHDPAALPLFFSQVQHADLITGSRFQSGGGMDNRVRWICSAVFNVWLRLLLGLKTRDNLAGYFLIKRSQFFELPLKLIFSDYGDYFFRLLYFGQAAGWKAREVPVWYKERTHGKSKTKFLNIFMKYSRAAIAFRLANLKNEQGRHGTKLLGKLASAIVRK